LAKLTEGAHEAAAILGHDSTPGLLEAGRLAWILTTDQLIGNDIGCFINLGPSSANRNDDAV
jgi:hypothetical protein